MEANNLKEAIEEAKRFIERTEQLQLAARLNENSTYIGGYPTEQGAVKRASMDLTRSLSKLRNN